MPEKSLVADHPSDPLEWDSVPVGLAAVDAQGVILRSNALAASSGLTAGQPLSTVLRPAPDAHAPRGWISAPAPSDAWARLLERVELDQRKRLCVASLRSASGDATRRVFVYATRARDTDVVLIAICEDETLATTPRPAAPSVAGEHEPIIGHAPTLRRVLTQVERVAGADTTVLIHGESGSGKELLARSIHAQSTRSGRAFVAVNCAALPESLIEAELFGHEKGAFTGADRRRAGRFEIADSGTLFLDEVAELSMAAQATLLRVLQSGDFVRVGGVETVRVDVRVIAATHRELAEQVRRGRFREDLFYRLNVFRIESPALRDRREDIPELARHLHKLAAGRLGRPVLPLSETSLRRMMAYRWPGNIRELSNAIERATLLSDGAALEVDVGDAPVIETAPAPGPAGRAPVNTEAPRDVLLDLTAEQLQRLQILHAVESSGGKVFGRGGAAERLGLNPHTLLSRMDRFGIARPRRRNAPADGSA